MNHWHLKPRIFVVYFAFQNATAPSAGDSLLITFNVPLLTLPVATQEDLDRLFLFDPPIDNVTYSGRCVQLRS